MNRFVFIFKIVLDQRNEDFKRNLHFLTEET